MPEHLVKLPASFRYLNQFAPSPFAPNPGLMGCGPASVAMMAEFCYPGRDNPEKLLADLYVKFIGPDNPNDPNGISEENLEKAMHSLGMGFVNMQPLVDRFKAGDRGPLHAELMAQNKQNVPQIIVIGDESRLYDASNPPKKLHAWADAGMSHVMVRVGFSDDAGYGLYMEPAAPGFRQPVEIPWGDIVNAGINHVYALMPPRVEPPPAGFLYQSGEWPAPPAPKPLFNREAALDALHILTASAETNAKALDELRHSLGV